MRAANALMRDEMRAEPVKQLPVRAFHHQIIIQRPKQRAEPVGIIQFPAGCRIGRAQAVREGLALARDQALKQPGTVAQRQFGDQRAVRINDLQVAGVRHEGADYKARLGDMGAQHLKRIAMAGRDNAIDITVRQSPVAISHVPPQLAYPLAGIGTFQISREYSAIVRSDENKPTLAVFNTPERHHASLRFHLASTLRCIAK